MEVTLSPDDMPSSERIAELQEMMDSLREYAPKDLDDWERRLLEVVDGFLKARGFLTAGQRAKLESLHAEHLGAPFDGLPL